MALWAGGAAAQEAASAKTLPVPQVQRRPDASPPAGARIFLDAQGRPVSPELQKMIEQSLARPRAPTAAAADGEIVVAGERPRGSVVGDVPAERSFDTLSIRAFGATDVNELIDAIAPQVRSNRGRGDAGPVTLLNGRRVSNFAEIARIPTEAIERMDVFPEELALRYGYRADQKVVNIVTFPTFRSTVAQASVLVPTEGGTSTSGLTADRLVLKGDTRLGVGFTLNRTSALLESERDLIQPGNFQESAGLRTLIPRAERLSLNGVIAAPLTREIGASLNAQFDTSNLSALLGPGVANMAIARSTQLRRGRIGTVVDGRAGRWLWSLTGGYDRSASDIRTAGAGSGLVGEFVHSVNAVADTDLVASGPLFSLPAGAVTTSIGGAVGGRAFSGTSIRGDTSLVTRLDRDRSAARANIDLPITRAGRGGIGMLSANISGEVERLSDAGTLTTIGGGVTWSPVAAVALVASLTREEGAPTVEQLGDRVL